MDRYTLPASETSHARSARLKRSFSKRSPVSRCPGWCSFRTADPRGSRPSCLPTAKGRPLQRATDRRDSFVRNFGDYEDTLTAFLIGKTPVGMRAADVVRGIEVLASRSDVDAARIAAVGRSAAAIPTLFAALFDDRIRSVAL